VLARSEAGLEACLMPLRQSGISIEPVITFDTSRGHSALTLEGADVHVLGERALDAGEWERLIEGAAVLFAWEQVGGADAALEMAKNYALGRYAFGRPIASYQAIKHKLAEMYVRNTLARSNCYYGAWALNTNAAELPIAAATARVSAIQAYYFASKENIQTHGGMGFTWEFDCQFHYRRSKILAVNVGSERQWQDKLITAIEQTSAA